MIIGECDICGKRRRLRIVIAYGIDTGACEECLGDPEDEEDVPPATEKAAGALE